MQATCHLRRGGKYFISPVLYLRFYSKKSNHSQWQGTVGLEIHAQIAAKTKIFAGSAVAFGAPANSHVGFFDAALPGTLPRLNKRCVEAAVQTGLALQGNVANRSYFDRKHYFYFDLPAGYQITQHRVPIVQGGHILLDEPHSRKVRIRQLHLEQDTGKTLHEGNCLLIDLNRANCGLMEIVTEPDMTCGEEAMQCVGKLQRLLQTLGTCSGDMEQGALRVDVNVSVSEKGQKNGVRVEVKNVNGTSHIKNAVDYEIKRQTKLLQAGGHVVCETRHYLWREGSTVALRAKEEEQDYRYMPEADLPPLDISMDWVETLAKAMPELPDAKLARLVEQYGISKGDGRVLLNHRGAIDYFERAARGRRGSNLAKWITTDIFGGLHHQGLTINQCPVSADRLGSLLDLVEAGTISGKLAKNTLRLMMHGDQRTPLAIVTENQWVQLSDPAAIESLCWAVIKEMPVLVARHREGNRRMHSTLVGEAIKKSGGRANPKMVDRIMAECLTKNPPV